MIFVELIYTLVGEINQENVSQAILWINGRIAEGNHNPIKFYLSSTGGDIDSAIRLYDFLKAIPNQVQTIGFAQVDSAAVLIFLAGEKRTAIKRCRFRIHESTYTAHRNVGSLPHHVDMLRFFEELDRRTKDIVACETNKPIDEVRALYQKGKIMSAEEAKDYGIVHTITHTLPVPPKPDLQKATS